MAIVKDFINGEVLALIVAHELNALPILAPRAESMVIGPQ